MLPASNILGSYSNENYVHFRALQVFKQHTDNQMSVFPIQRNTTTFIAIVLSFSGFFLTLGEWILAIFKVMVRYQQHFTVKFT